MSRYAPLLSLSARHDFFGDQPCPTIEFHADRGTLALIRRAGLVLRTGPGAARVYYDEGRADVMRLFVEDSDDPFRLFFRVRSVDPAFANYTAPSPFREGAVLYLDTADDGLHRLDGTVRLTDQFLDLAQEGPDVAADDSSAAGESPTDAGGPVKEMGLEGVITARDRMVPPLAVVSLGLDASVAPSLGGSGFTAPEYALSFGVRQTHWRYYLLGPLAELSSRIIDLAEEIEFEREGRGSLPGNRTAVIFTSRTKIPLRHRSDRRFQLREIENRNGNGRVLVKRLPVASADGISVGSVDGQQTILSDIYVNN